MWTGDVSPEEGAKQYGPFDIVFEATGSAAMVFEAMKMLGRNGVLILFSATFGAEMVEAPAARINAEFVLWNKAMAGTVNANRIDFEAGVRDLKRTEGQFPGWLSSLLTHPVEGLDNYRELMRLLMEEQAAVKVFMHVKDG